MEPKRRCLMRAARFSSEQKIKKIKSNNLNLLLHQLIQKINQNKIEFIALHMLIHN
jgi:uncharacterized protein YukE